MDCEAAPVLDVPSRLERLGEKDMNSLPHLLNDLSEAINQALWRSNQVLDAASALEQQVGNFRISIDVLLPSAASEPDDSELQLLRSYNHDLGTGAEGGGSSAHQNAVPRRSVVRAQERSCLPEHGFGAASKTRGRKFLIRHGQWTMR